MPEHGRAWEQKDLEAAGIAKGALCCAIGGKGIKSETDGKIDKAFGVGRVKVTRTLKQCSHRYKYIVLFHN